MGLLTDVITRTHIANGYHEPILAFVDTKRLDTANLSNKMKAQPDHKVAAPLWNDNHSSCAKGYVEMHELFSILIKEIHINLRKFVLVIIINLR